MNGFVKYKMLTHKINKIKTYSQGIVFSIAIKEMSTPGLKVDSASKFCRLGIKVVYKFLNKI